MFVGREKELKKLREFEKRKSAGLIVVSGRRRIGKSTLIEHFAKGCRFYEFWGLGPRENLTNEDQLKHFAELLSINFKLPKITLDNWNEAFITLANLTSEGKVIVLLDEISWMAGKDADFSGKLKGAWDTHFKKNPKLLMFLCGSVTSWIEDNILNDKGFMGRISLTMRLEELSLLDANQFWGKHQISAAEKFKILCVTGGIPRYLEEIYPKETAEENIKRLCFSPEGILVDEFDKIFKDTFGKQDEGYITVVNSLVNGSKSIEEVANFLKTKTTGSLSKKIKALEQSGFISRDFVWMGQTQTRKSKLRLRDNYLRFYLKYIAPKIALIKQGIYDAMYLEDLPEWRTIMGLQFENLVLNHLNQILQVLKIPPSSIRSASPYFQQKTQRTKPCQIDLLIQTRHSFYVCEVKFCNTIDFSVIDEVKEKIARMSISNGLSIRPVLIYQGALSPKILQEDFFTHLISFQELLA